MVWIGDKEYTPEEYEARSRQESQERMKAASADFEAKAAERREAERLIRKLGAAYTEYQRFLETRPHLRPRATGRLSEDQAFYEQLRRNLGHADDAPRCSHIMADGLRCGSPRMKTGALCYAHQRMAQATSISLRLNYEDPNSIQLGLMEVSRALVEREISGKDAGRLLYALQIAAANVDRVTFHQAPAQIVLEDSAEEPRQPSPPEVSCEPTDKGSGVSAASDEMDRGDCGRFTGEASSSVEAMPEHVPVLDHTAIVVDPAYKKVEGEPAYRDGS
jgi:hypothetical protein